jgi:hypothetical protein
MTICEAASRRASSIWRAVSSSCTSAAPAKFSIASASELASIWKVSGIAPIGVSSCAWPTNSTGRALSSAPLLSTGVKRRMVPTRWSLNTSSRYSASGSIFSSVEGSWLISASWLGFAGWAG